MYTDTMTLDFILVFIAVVLLVVLLFPFIDFVSAMRSGRRQPSKPAADDDEALR